MDFSKILSNKKIQILVLLFICLMLFPQKETMKVSKYNGVPVTFYNFNTKWCYYSKRMQPVWDKLDKYYKKNKKVTIKDINCDKDKKLCKKFNVEKYPTLIRVKNGEKVQYDGERVLASFIKFVEN